MKRRWCAWSLGIVCLLGTLGFSQGFGGGGQSFTNESRSTVDGVDLLEALSSVVNVESRVTYQGAEVSEKHGIGLVVARKLVSLAMPDMGGGIGRGMGAGMGGTPSKVPQHTIVVPAFLVQKEAAYNLVEGELDRSLSYSTVQGMVIFETDGSNRFSVQIDDELAFITVTPTRLVSSDMPSVSATKYHKILKETEKEKLDAFAITFNDERNCDLVRKFEAKVQSDLSGIPDGCLLVNQRQAEGLIIKEKLYTIPELISRFIALKSKEDPFGGDGGQQPNLKAGLNSASAPFYEPQGKEDPFNDGDPQLITKGLPSSQMAIRNQNPQLAAILKIIQTTKNKETKEKTEQALRALLEEEFDAVVAKNESEIRSLTDRIQSLKTAEEERKKNRKKIIDERLNSLMNTNAEVRR